MNDDALFKIKVGLARAKARADAWSDAARAAAAEARKKGGAGKKTDIDAEHHSSGASLMASSLAHGYGQKMIAAINAPRTPRLKVGDKVTFNHHTIGGSRKVEGQVHWDYGKRVAIKVGSQTINAERHPSGELHHYS